MNSAKRRSLAALLFLGLGLSVLLSDAGTAPAQTKAVLSGQDCVKCHVQRASDIAAAGGGHKSIPCTGCHVGHPPDVKKPYAPCSACHSKRKSPHFEEEGCLNCHTNPHRPMNISLKGASKNTCEPCHWPEYVMLRSNASKHWTLDCSQCHAVHGEMPQCSQCHKPHQGKIVGNCKPCHQHAHRPKVEILPETAPSLDCGMCHKIVADLLSATKSKHRNLGCSGCHKQKHGMIPACQDCHGSPHPASILVKFPQCLMCHYSPHDLNNWPETATPTAAGEAPKK
jgi:hypothetical protein